MGTADVIPGVSGGTIAFIMGIYGELINAIKSFDHIWLKSFARLDFKTILYRPHLAFLVPLLAGIFCALMFFTRIVSLPGLLIEYPEEIYGLFFGLIAGSIIVLFQEMARINISAILSYAAGILAGMIVFNLVPMETPEAAWFIFLSGALAICAMILPGISGSFILLILNKYPYIFNAIGNLDFKVLIPFILGAVAGLIVFSRILSWLLKKYYQTIVLVILGLLTASLWVIWPFQNRTYEIIRNKSRLIGSTPYLPSELSQTVLFAVFMIIVGFVIVIAINRLAIIREKVAE